MKYLKLFKNFNDEFIFFIKDKLVELSDENFSVKVDDKKSKPDLENMIHILIRNKTTDKYGNTHPFKFYEISDVLADILLSNNDWLKTDISGEIKTEPLYKQTHVFVQIAGKVYIINGYEQRTDNKGVRGERISWTIRDNEIEWSFENPNSINFKKFTESNPLNLVCKAVEVFFE